MKISLKRKELPMEEGLLQGLVATGHITQEKSGEEVLAEMLGLTYKKNPLEEPCFKVDSSIIINLLEGAKFDPVESKASTISSNRHLANKYSTNVNVSQSNIYIKTLYNHLITEVGFSFESNPTTDLHNNLNDAKVRNTIGNDQQSVYVPFFITQWNDNKDKYDFFNISMDNFSQWLRESFSHSNIPYEIDVLLKEFSKVLEQHEYSKIVINFNDISQAIKHLKEQFPFEKKQESSLVKIESENHEKDRAKAIKLSIDHGFYAIPHQTLKPSQKTEIPEDYICPITQEVMKNPVFCTLDKLSYEKDQITQWLTMKRTSPITRDAMNPGDLVGNVLFPNITLRNAIEAFKETNPDLFKDKEPTVTI